VDLEAAGGSQVWAALLQAAAIRHVPTHNAGVIDAKFLSVVASLRRYGHDRQQTATSDEAQPGLSSPAAGHPVCWCGRDGLGLGNHHLNAMREPSPTAGLHGAIASFKRWSRGQFPDLGPAGVSG
jgi:hypothetical protein